MHFSEIESPSLRASRKPIECACSEPSPIGKTFVESCQDTENPHYPRTSPLRRADRCWLYGAYRWNAGTQELRARLDAGRVPIQPQAVDFGELEGLPTPVQRYLRAVLEEKQPMVASVRMHHSGTSTWAKPRINGSPSLRSNSWLPNDQASTGTCRNDAWAACAGT